MTRLTTCVDAEAVAVRAAEEITRQLNLALEQRGVAHLALSGGTTPARTYELLAGSPVEWQRTDVWFADERCVGPEDDESNYRLAAESLLATRRRAARAGPPHGGRARAGARAQTLRRGARERMLPIDDEGCRCSTWSSSGSVPTATSPRCSRARARSTRPRRRSASACEDSPKPPPERITLSLQMLRVARCCVLLATGAAKADAVDAMLGEPSRHVPASLLRRERLTVIADDSASPAPAEGMSETSGAGAPTVDPRRPGSRAIRCPSPSPHRAPIRPSRSSMAHARARSR